MKQLNLTTDLYKYLQATSLDEHPVLKALRHHTSSMKLANMQISPVQGQFMQLLIRLIGAKNVLELGTFTGYSALAMALALPNNGKVITCDINTEWTDHAHPFWQQAQQENKIDLRIAPALESLEQLIADGYPNSFDFIFIDADKTNYSNYYEFALQLISPRGLIVIDNVLWGGKVIDPAATDGQTRGILKLNKTIKSDPRVYSSLIPLDDGLFLIQPRTEMER